MRLFFIICLLASLVAFAICAFLDGGYWFDTGSCVVIGLAAAFFGFMAWRG